MNSPDLSKQTVVLSRGQALISGKLIRRRHRFLIDVLLADGSIVTGHCANPGRMEGMVRPGARVWLSKKCPTKGVARLAWTWELIEIDDILVSTNSWSANEIVYSLLEQRLLRGLRDFKSIRAERKLGRKSRVDFVLERKGGIHLIEVKNGHLVYPDGIAYFPDALTVRSVRHIQSLERQIKRGVSATLIVAVQRSDAKCVRPSDFHDREFAMALRKAARAGLRIRALLLEPTLKGVIFRGEIPVDLKVYCTDQISMWHNELKTLSGWERPKGNPNAPWRSQRKPQ